MNNNKHTSAFPTFPLQDQFGQVQVGFGLTKLEFLTALLTPAAIELIKHDNEPPLIIPESVAPIAVTLAELVIKKCEDKFIEDNPTPGKISLHGTARKS